MNKELTSIKDWSRGDLETFSQEAYDMLRWVRETLSLNNFEERLNSLDCVHDEVYDFLAEWETPLEDD